jgi:putative endopeptidase
MRLRLSKAVLLAAGSMLAFAPAAAQAAPAATASTTGTLGQVKSYGSWGVDLTARDMSVRPGDDFDNYANGAWRAKTQIPADQASAGVGYDVYNLTQDQLRAVVSKAPTDGKIGALYASFMDEARLEQLDAKPLMADLAKVAAIKDKSEIARFMGRSQGAFG